MTAGPTCSSPATPISTLPVSSDSGFPNTYLGVRDLLYLNIGERQERSRQVPGDRREGADRRGKPEHGLGAVFTDVNGDGRLDLYVANDANPNRLYENVAVARRREDGSARPRLPTRGARGAARHRRPERRHGDRCRRLQRRRPTRPPRHQLAQAVAWGLPQRSDRHAARPRSATPARTSRRRSTRASQAGAPHGSISTTTPTSISCSRTAPSRSRAVAKSAEPVQALREPDAGTAIRGSSQPRVARRRL